MQVKEFNHLTLIAKRLDGSYIPEERLKLARDITFNTLYPAGLFGQAQFKLPRDAREILMLSGGHKIYIYNGVNLVWEGSIDNLLENPRGGLDGSSVECIGAWGVEFERKGTVKRWIDNRLEATIWRWDTAASGAGAGEVDRTDRLRLTPKSEAWANGQLIRLIYSMPTGETIKRVTLDYNFSETGEIQPPKFIHNNDADDANTYTDLSNAIDGDVATNVSVTLTTDDFLYFQRPSLEKCDGFRLNIGASVNNNAATLTLQQFTGVPRTVTPLAVWHEDGAFNDLPNTYDNNTGTSETVSLTSNDYLYIRTRESRCLGFQFDFGATVNAVEAETFVEKYDGTDWRFIFQREKGTDEKGAGTIPFAKDGKTVLRSEEEETVNTTVDSVAGFWWRISWDANLTANIVINEVYALSGWNDLTIVNGTVSAGAPFAVDGAITWTDDNAQVDTKVNGTNGKWYRLKTSADLDAVTLIDVYAQSRQAWELRLYDPVGAANIWSVTATGSGSRDDVLATPRQTLYLELISRAVQTPPSNGTIFGGIEPPYVLSETSNINAYEVANDIRGALTNLSADTTALDANSIQSLAPRFLAHPFEMYASLMERAVALGGSSYATLVYGLRSSQFASDAKPIMFLEEWPDTSDANDYDYWVTTKTAQVPMFRRDYSSILNWIAIGYVTNNEGVPGVLTPADDSLLTDAASVARYGRRDVFIETQVDSANAAFWGRRYLAAYKDPLISATGPIVVQEYIHHRTGFIVPASEIVAGKRLKIADYEEGIMGVITQTQYNHANRSCSMTLGISDSLAVLLARGLDKGQMRL